MKTSYFKNRLLTTRFAAIIFLFFSINSFSQIKTPTIWTFKAIKKNANSYKIIIDVKIEPKWHIYAQNAGKGPVSTEIHFDTNPLITLNKNIQEEGILIKKFDKAFNSILNYYENHLTFTQNINIKAKIKTQLNGYVYYMVCDDSKCLPPTKEKFSISIE